MPPKKVAPSVVQPEPEPMRVKGSPKARRSAARLAAVQALYQLELADGNTEVVLKDFLNHYIGRDMDGEQFVTADLQLFSEIVRGAAYRKADIDPMIVGAMGGDTAHFERMEALLRAVLRAGAFELLGHVDTPAGIIINDYVEVGRAFFGGKEPGLVNGVLDRLGKVLRAGQDTENGDEATE